MRIGIIGPNRAPQLSKSELQERKNNLSRLAEMIAKSGFEILLTPDKNSLLEFFAKEYHKSKGKKIYEIVPLDDNYEQYLNTELGEIISCGKWPCQPSKFNEECQAMFCVGYGGMVLAEIGFSGYYNPKKVYLIKEFISTELPKETGLKIEYVSIKEIPKLLEKLK